MEQNKKYGVAVEVVETVVRNVQYIGYTDTQEEAEKILDKVMETKTLNSILDLNNVERVVLGEESIETSNVYPDTGVIVKGEVNDEGYFIYGVYDEDNMEVIKRVNNNTDNNVNEES